MNRLSLPVDSQMRALSAIEHIVNTNGKLFDDVKANLKERWRAFLPIMESKRSWKILSDRESTPPYAWLERLDGKDAVDILAYHHITAEPGASYSVHNHFCRISFFVHDSTFELLLNRLRTLAWYHICTSMNLLPLKACVLTYGPRTKHFCSCNRFEVAQIGSNLSQLQLNFNLGLLERRLPYVWSCAFNCLWEIAIDLGDAKKHNCVDTRGRYYAACALRSTLPGKVRDAR